MRVQIIETLWTVAYSTARSIRTEDALIRQVARPTGVRLGARRAREHRKNEQRARPCSQVAVRRRLTGFGAYAARRAAILSRRFQFVDRTQRRERELALQEPARDPLHGRLIDRLDAGHDLGVRDRAAMDDQVAGRLLPTVRRSIPGPSACPP